MSACASCGAEIVWVRTDRGRSMPVEPDPAGAWTVDGGRLVRYVDGEDGPRFRSHFATCPDAARWRKARWRGDR